MLTDAIKRYFLRVYAAELSQPQDRQAHWGAFGEAAFQTVFLVSLPLGGITGAVIVLAPSTLDAWLTVNRSAIISGIAAAVFTTSYLIVRRLVREFRGSPQSASPYTSRRDRIICNAQFWGVFVSSLSLPFAAALFGWLVH